MITTCPDPKTFALCRIRDGNTDGARPATSWVMSTSAFTRHCLPLHLGLPAARAVFSQSTSSMKNLTVKGVLQQAKSAAHGRERIGYSPNMLRSSPSLPRGREGGERRAVVLGLPLPGLATPASWGGSESLRWYYQGPPMGVKTAATK